MRSPKGGRRYQKKIAKVFNIHDGKSDFDKKKVFFLAWKTVIARFELFI